MKLCECGCGKEVKEKRRFIHGHNWKGKIHTKKTKKIMSKNMEKNWKDPKYRIKKSKGMEKRYQHMRNRPPEEHPLYGKKHKKESKIKEGLTKKRNYALGKTKAWNDGKPCLLHVKKAISNANKGKRHSPKTEFKKGHTPWNFNNWSSKEPYDKKWTNKFKRAIRKRDNQICMLCGIHREKLNRALDVHHINYDKKMSIPQNCISLCKKCHGLTGKDKEQWIKLFQEKLSKHFDYKYSESQEIILNLKKEVK